MTLKEELEILRGEPIQVFTGDPMDIPCIETSDPASLCRHPVVSVNMITYNHEPYIRQAIEGVMMQKTDFEFELVIGEDCSTDRTREICFEYQKRYPDKIRVLWCDHNLYRNPHPAGGNGERNMAHCRGEFIALCEGDDYWTDPLKLQKQVDVMRKYPSVSLCFCRGDRYLQKKETLEVVDYANAPSGVLIGRDVIAQILVGGSVSCPAIPFHCFLTASSLIRRTVLNDAVRIHKEVFSYGLRLGDTTTWLALMGSGDAFFYPHKTMVYRVHPGGLTQFDSDRLARDGIVVRAYFLHAYFNLPIMDAVRIYADTIFFSYVNVLSGLDGGQQKIEIEKLKRNRHIGSVFCSIPSFPYVFLLRRGWLRRKMLRLLSLWYFHVPFKNRKREKIVGSIRSR